MIKRVFCINQFNPQYRPSFRRVFKFQGPGRVVPFKLNEAIESRHDAWVLKRTQKAQALKCVRCSFEGLGANLRSIALIPAIFEGGQFVQPRCNISQEIGNRHLSFKHYFKSTPEMCNLK